MPSQSFNSVTHHPKLLNYEQNRILSARKTRTVIPGSMLSDIMLACSSVQNICRQTRPVQYELNIDHIIRIPIDENRDDCTYGLYYFENLGTDYII